VRTRFGRIRVGPIVALAHPDERRPLPGGVELAAYRTLQYELVPVGDAPATVALHCLPDDDYDCSTLSAADRPHLPQPFDGSANQMPIGSLDAAGQRMIHSSWTPERGSKRCCCS
jgi:hypothetical protein